MAMSRKHYREVAEIIQHAEVVYGELPGNYATTYIAGQLAGFFARDNSNFDKDKFLDACGMRVPLAPHGTGPNVGLYRGDA